ncbi:MAG: DUF2007 domain-containing protein [Kordiimonas sp.]
MTANFEQQDRLVTLRGGLDPSDAQLLRSLLEGNGVKVFMNGEYMSSVHPAVRADIMVRASDWKEAEQVIQKVATMPRCAIPTRLDEDGEERACEQCGSTRVHRFEGEVPTFIPGIRLAAQKQDDWFHCLQCDSYYKDKRSRFSGLPFALMWSACVGLFVICLYWLIDWLKYL